jgi:hypothetical protein
MGYAIKPNGSWRAVTPEMALMDDETYAETLPEPTPEQIADEKRAVIQQAVRLLLEQSIV